MCRIFGFRSVIPSQVHSSLISADNALLHQSTEHPDGWGVSYYVGESPHIIKSASTALHDSLFKQVSGIVSSETVVAHIRKSTQGDNSILNTHPFQFGKWVFVHNGNIKNFDIHREPILSAIGTQMRRFVLGETDSELIFFLILTQLAKRVDLHRYGCRVEDIFDAIEEAMNILKSIVGDFAKNDDAEPSETFLTFVLTNGHNMVAFQGGKRLYYSTYKSQCSERLTCPSFAQECEAPTQSGYVNHLLFSSEKLSGENIWNEMKPSQLMGVDWNMRFKIR